MPGHNRHPNLVSSYLFQAKKLKTLHLLAIFFQNQLHSLYTGNATMPAFSHVNQFLRCSFLFFFFIRASWLTVIDEYFEFLSLLLFPSLHVSPTPLLSPSHRT